MELGEKLQHLRRQKGLTQEDVAGALYVSRTAVSKWESGRGYPSIDSLKAIAVFFGVTVDELLSGEEILCIAENDSKEKENRLKDIVFGLLDIGISMLLFLPFFGQKAGDAVEGVSLLALSEVSLWLRITYYILVCAITVCGIVTLVLQSCDAQFWKACKSKASIALGAAAAVLFIISLQPYAATFVFVFLIIKALMLIKWQ